MPNKKVLLFTYYWPPAAGPGVQRWLKFCKFLGQFGVEVTVVTPQKPSASNYDDTLIMEIPPEIKVIRTKSFEPFELYKILKGQKKGEQVGVGGIGLFDDRSFKQRTFNYIRANFFIPDARKGWNKYALKSARSLLKGDSFDLIITTGPPHSTHLIGRKLKREFQIPWIADFRDPWINIYYNKLFPRTISTVKKDQQLEDSVLKEANAVLAVSPGLKKEFEDRNNNVEIILNGFDQEDLPEPNEQNNPKFTISYVGNFKPNQSCPSFWKAAKKFIETNNIEDISFRLTGNVDGLIKSSITENNLEDFVIFENYKAHKEATFDMVHSDALLFIVPQTEHNDLILTGKLFEYLASGTPLISIGPSSGNAAEIIEETGRGKTFNYLDEQSIFDRLNELYQDWKISPTRNKLSSELVKEYSRLGMTEKLAQTIYKHSDDKS